jgi:hypothetical protein
MSTGRYAALLGVILVIGVAGVAQAAPGNPLIIGAANTSEGPGGLQPTTLLGDFDPTGIRNVNQIETRDLNVTHLDAYGAYVSGVLELRASTFTTIAAGTSAKTFPLDTPDLNSTAVFCTVQTPKSGAVLDSARINAANPTNVTVTMSGPVTKATKVACMRVLVP